MTLLIFITIGILGLGMILGGGICLYHIWLNEFMAQLETNGFYNEHITLIDQMGDKIFAASGIIIGVIIVAISLGLIIFRIIEESC